jgi:hypothetical protein
MKVLSWNILHGGGGDVMQFVRRLPFTILMS